jgi:hypothetical protein
MASKKKIDNTTSKNKKSKLYADKKSKKEDNSDNESEEEIGNKLTKLNVFDQPIKRKIWKMIRKTRLIKN